MLEHSAFFVYTILDQHLVSFHVDTGGFRMTRVLLNVGCGQTRPLNWINTDCSLNSHFQRIALLKWFLVKCLRKVEYSQSNVRYMNLNKAWPFQTASVDVVYGSHIFEHLNRASAKLFLEESL